jgi:hypothetical protein
MEKKYTRDNLARYLKNISEACQEMAMKLSPSEFGVYDTKEEKYTLDYLLGEEFGYINTDDLILLLNEKIELVD